MLAMIARIADFSTILCSNELEALVLESTLIKKHQPHYNILLRDDRDYPYLRVTLNETYPRLLKASGSARTISWAPVITAPI